MANDDEESTQDFGDEVYEESTLEQLEEDDEISPAEEAFMEGYQKMEKKLKRKQAKKVKPGKVKRVVTKKKKKRS